jgi:hypothetical protein
MVLVRLFLILIIAYLVIKAFLGFGTREQVSKPKPERDDKYPPKKVSKEIGEYVDYEEIKKEKQPHKTSSKS